MASGQIQTPNELMRNIQYIARSAWGDDAYFNGFIDELAIFDRALSPEEVESIYQGEFYQNNVPWIVINPISGTVTTSSFTPIQVTFDTTDLQPDVYTTTLYVVSNDPLNSIVAVPVTMTVEPTSSMGWVEGYVTDQRTGEPLEATIIAQGQPYMVTSNAETGYYKLWLEQGTYTLQAGSMGYLTQITDVEITAQQGSSANFILIPLQKYYLPSVLKEQ